MTCLLLSLLGVFLVLMAAIIFKGLVGRLKKDMLKGENDDINPSSLLSYEEVHFINLSCKIFVETCIKIFMVLLLAFVMLYMSILYHLCIIPKGVNIVPVRYQLIEVKGDINLIRSGQILTGFYIYK